jgi:pyrroloquinoline quinone biosynthesis protein D
MSSTLFKDQRLKIATAFRLQWEKAQQCYVLLFPEGMVTLNTTASEILTRCDGRKTVSDIIEELKRCYPAPELEADVIEFLEVARTKGWICAD